MDPSIAAAFSAGSIIAPIDEKITPEKYASVLNSSDSKFILGREVHQFYLSEKSQAQRQIDRCRRSPARNCIWWVI